MQPVNKKRYWHTRKYLMSLINYDPKTGIFKRRIVRSKNKCGSLDAAGYLIIEIDDVAYKAHRLAWFFQTGRWPVRDIDHANGVKNNNVFANLRQASRAENNCNVKFARKDSGTSIRGVRKTKSGKWSGAIQKNFKRIERTFSNREQAIAFRKALEIMEFGRFAP